MNFENLEVEGPESSDSNENPFQTSKEPEPPVKPIKATMMAHFQSNVSK